jgi:hypothetical protein
MTASISRFNLVLDTSNSIVDSDATIIHSKQKHPHSRFISSLEQFTPQPHQPPRSPS